MPISGTLSTVPDTAAVRNTVYPGDDAVVGVAAPITVYFGVEPADKAAVAAHVTLTSDPAVEGAWAWIQHNDGRWALDYRTKDYWPAGTKVHVSAQLYGVPLAPGAYGAADITSDFTIGRNQVVIADVNSHQLVVQRDGATVATYPASYGRGEDTGDPNLITRSGIHVVNELDETKLMSNPRYGYSNVPEKWAVRISNNGEFIHANPASSDAQGNTNVTHGCVNLSLADAEDYFHSAIWGDPVEVTGTSVTLGPDDGDIYIWATQLGPMEGEIGRLRTATRTSSTTMVAPGPSPRVGAGSEPAREGQRWSQISVPNVADVGIPIFPNAADEGMTYSRCQRRN